MRIAVTGAHGLLGGEVVRALAERGHEVVAIVRRPAPVTHAAAVHPIPMSETDRLIAALEGTTRLVHVAGIQLADHLVSIGLHRFEHVVVVSTAGIYSKHRRSVASYRRSEDALRAARPDVALVRPTMIYGSSRDRNVHRVIDFALRWRFLPVPGDGHALIHPIHYLDLAGGLAGISESAASGPIDAGGGAPLSIMEAARAVMRTLGLPERIVRIPLAALRFAASAIDLRPGSRWRERVDRTLEDRVVDNSRFIAISGIMPRDLPSGLQQMVGSR